MSIILKGLGFVAAMLAGAVGGAVAAFFATVYFCVFVDWLKDAQGGDGLVTVGWVFCLITIPIGFYYGGSMGYRSAALLAASHREKRRKSSSDWSDQFSDASQVPRGRDWFYQCRKCGDQIPSEPSASIRCRCGNVSIDARSPDTWNLTVEDFSGFQVVRNAEA